MEQLELHDGQLAGVSILAAKGSHLGDGPGGFAVCNMCVEEQFASHTTGHVTVLWIWTSGGLDIYGSMKELVVPDRKCLHFDILKLTGSALHE